MADDRQRTPTLLQIGWLFTRYANLTFGGGSATIAVLQKQIVARRQWLSELEFNLGFALSRLTPGTNLLAFCTAVGWMKRRWSGAVVALLAASIPCSIIAVIATHFFEVWQQHPMFLAAIRGALAAAVAVMFNTAWVLAAPHVKTSVPKAAVIVPGAIALVVFAGLSPFQVLLVAAVAGVLWPAEEAKE